MLRIECKVYRRKIAVVFAGVLGLTAIACRQSDSSSSGESTTGGVSLPVNLVVVPNLLHAISVEDYLRNETELPIENMQKQFERVEHNGVQYFVTSNSVALAAWPCQPTSWKGDTWPRASRLVMEETSLDSQAEARAGASLVTCEIEKVWKDAPSELDRLRLKKETLDALFNKYKKNQSSSALLSSGAKTFVEAGLWLAAISPNGSQMTPARAKEMIHEFENPKKANETLQPPSVNPRLYCLASELKTCLSRGGGFGCLAEHREICSSVPSLTRKRAQEKVQPAIFCENLHTEGKGILWYLSVWTEQEKQKPLEERVDNALEHCQSYAVPLLE